MILDDFHAGCGVHDIAIPTTQFRRLVDFYIHPAVILCMYVHYDTAGPSSLYFGWPPKRATTRA